MSSHHVVLDYSENKFHCRHCGEKVSAPIPCRVETLCEMAEAFNRVHKACETKEENVESEEALRKALGDQQ